MLRQSAICRTDLYGIAKNYNKTVEEVCLFLFSEVNQTPYISSLQD